MKLGKGAGLAIGRRQNVSGHRPVCPLFSLLVLIPKAHSKNPICCVGFCRSFFTLPLFVRFLQYLQFVGRFRNPRGRQSRPSCSFWFRFSCSACFTTIPSDPKWPCIVVDVAVSRYDRLFPSCFSARLPFLIGVWCFCSIGRMSARSHLVDGKQQF